MKTAEIDALVPPPRPSDSWLETCPPMAIQLNESMLLRPFLLNAPPSPVSTLASRIEGHALGYEDSCSSAYTLLDSAYSTYAQSRNRTVIGLGPQR